MIDVIRGVALLGILLANMRGFAAPFAVYFSPDKLWPGFGDRLAQAALDCLVSGKFISIFAALFGLGFAIQMERAEARQEGLGFFRRRMAVLALIGLAHSFLLWWGDILLTYALAGFLLTGFRGRTSPSVLRWAVGLYLSFLLPMGVWWAVSLTGAAPAIPDAAPEEIRKTIEIYSAGSFSRIFVERAREWVALNTPILIFVPRILSLFLFGVCFWRCGWLRHPEAHEDWWKRAQRIGLAAGLPLNLLMVAVQWIWRPHPLGASTPAMVMMLAGMAGVPLLSLFYAATIVRTFQTAAGRLWLEPFAAVGRMALTNYLTQSLVATTLFYSYGFGLFGRFGPLSLLPPSFAIYFAQVLFSRWWLARHERGPAEWLWRRLTYAA